MEIKKSAVAGTLESSDIMVTAAPNDEQKISITLESSVEKQFGDQIRHVIKETVMKTGVTAIKITAVDKGALDCTIKARTLTAIHRAAENNAYNWKEIDSWNV